MLATCSFHVELKDQKTWFSCQQVSSLIEMLWVTDGASLTCTDADRSEVDLTSTRVEPTEEVFVCTKTPGGEKSRV